MVNVKISIVSDDTRMTQQLVQNLNFMNHPIGELIDKPREAYRHLNSKEPRVILLVEPSEPLSLTQAVQQLRKVNESAPIIYLCKDGNFETLREIYRSGIFEVLCVPDELEQLESVLERALRLSRMNRQRLEQASAVSAAGGGKMISVYSGKGGSGTTVVGANLAQALALHTSSRVLLIDLNLQFGGIQHLLNIHFERNLGDLKTVLRELTLNQISNVLYKVDSSGLQVLLSPSHPQEAEIFKSEDMELLFTACRQYFDYIVLDLPKELNEVSISALSQSDYVLYVINLDRPSIVRMQNVMDILDRYHLLNEDQLALVINKFSGKTDITVSDLTKMTSTPILGKVSDDRKHKLQTQVNLGQLLLNDAKVKGLKGPPKDILQLMNDLLLRLGGEKHVHLPKAQQPVG